MAKKKVGTLVEEPVVTLKDIVAIYPEGMFVFPEVFNPLIEQGLVEINPSMTDGDAVITRATQAGIDFVNSGATFTEPVKEVKKMEKLNIVIEDNVPKPEKTGRFGGRETIYPIDKLEVGQSFFLPDTAERPNIAASIASTVAANNAKFSIDDPEGKTRLNKKGETVPVKIRTRSFSVVKCEYNGVSGARVYRDK